MPSADFSTAIQPQLPAAQLQLPATPWRPPVVRHESFLAQAPDLQNAPTPALPPALQMEGLVVTCPLAPDASRLISGFCSSPRDFALDFLRTPPRDDALVLWLTFGSADTWYRDFHPAGFVPCTAHTSCSPARFSASGAASSWTSNSRRSARFHTVSLKRVRSFRRAEEIDELLRYHLLLRGNHDRR